MKEIKSLARELNTPNMRGLYKRAQYAVEQRIKNGNPFNGAEPADANAKLLLECLEQALFAAEALEKP